MVVGSLYEIVHPRKLTCMPKMMVLHDGLQKVTPLNMAILGIYVRFLECVWMKPEPGFLMKLRNVLAPSELRCGASHHPTLEDKRCGRGEIHQSSQSTCRKYTCSSSFSMGVSQNSELWEAVLDA